MQQTQPQWRALETMLMNCLIYRKETISKQYEEIGALIKENAKLPIILLRMRDVRKQLQNLRMRLENANRNT